MIQTIALALFSIALGIYFYVVKFKNKEKPKAGVKRENWMNYLKDYNDHKSYYTWIALIVFGAIVLASVLLIELTFEN